MDHAWADEVCEFWFSQLEPKAWFEKNENVDQQIRDRFAQTYDRLAGIEDIGSLLTYAKVALAAVIVLDQFPRNMFRGTSRMFESDAKALSVAKRAVELGLDAQVPAERRLFFYLPFEHSEQIGHQRRSVELFRRWVEAHEGDAARNEAEDTFRYALRHCEIVERFGRFPHRNLALGRESTPEELAFLSEPMSDF